MKRTNIVRALAPLTLSIAFIVGGPASQSWAQKSPAEKPAPSKTASSTPAALVDINTATEAELQEVSGIGESYATKIIANRPYATVDELSKTGIPAYRLAKITPMVTVKAKAATKSKAASKTTGAEKASDKSTAKTTGGAADAATSKPALVDVNTATAAQLEEVNGIGPSYAKKIIANRPYTSLKDLTKTGISAKSLAKIEPLLTVAPLTAQTEKPAEPKATTATKTGDAPTTTTTTTDKTGAKTTDKTADNSTKPAKPARTLPPAQTPPQKGMVWVNKDTKIYHVEGDRYYGRTKNGEWMTEEDAKKAGCRPVKTKQKDAEPQTK